jgi:hypothetical protein
MHKAFSRIRQGDSWASSALAQVVKLSEDNKATRKSLLTPKKRPDTFNVYEQARLRCEGKDFFVTENNMMGVCQGRTLKEDEVYLVLGCSKPVVLRRSDEGTRSRS